MKRIVLLLIVISLFSCKNPGKGNLEVELKDDLGKSFKIDRSPEKVISLAPSITEIIYFIGADSRLAGVTKYCDYPPEAKNKTIIGGLLDPNLELISQIKPDLIFLTTEGNSQMTYKSLTDIGYKVFVMNPRNIDDIVITMEKLNKILNPPGGGNKISEFKKSIQAYKDNPKTNSTYAAFLSVKPLITFNDNTFIGDIFKQSGFNNLFGKEKLDYPGIYEEDILLKNPDYLFVLSDTSLAAHQRLNDEIGNRFNDIKAYKEKKFYYLDENVFSRPGPRVLDALKKLYEVKNIGN
ncbi:MAG: helical backbone metal receptor [Ignavibacteria bacterium]|nr:helical backbone metal receptor [Ignavibacteria bacterium]